MYGSVGDQTGAGAVADVDVAHVEGNSTVLGPNPEVVERRVVRRHLYVNEDEKAPHIFSVCSETLTRRDCFTREHIVLVLLVLLMSLFVVAVAYQQTETSGFSKFEGLDCIFSSTGISKTLNTTTPAP
jgi:hypothetical protein